VVLTVGSPKEKGDPATCFTRFVPCFSLGKTPCLPQLTVAGRGKPSGTMDSQQRMIMERLPTAGRVEIKKNINKLF